VNDPFDHPACLGAQRPDSVRRLNIDAELEYEIGLIDLCSIHLSAYKAGWKPQPASSGQQIAVAIK
jgi:hypothetical protein